MNRKLLTTAVITLTVFTGAQGATPVRDNTPQAGDFTAGISLGSNNYTNVNALDPDLNNYSQKAITNAWNESQLMLGLEIGYFISDNWKLNIGGGYNFDNNPGYEGIKGTIDKTGDYSLSDGSIPDYNLVPEQSNMNFLVTVGANRYFHLQNTPNLLWYTGINAMYAYGQDRYKAQGEEVTNDGRSVAETWTLGAAAVLGAEYHFTKGIYVGAQVDVASYRYSLTTAVPQPGVKGLQADAHSVGAIASPTLTVGFCFGNTKGKK